jgi:hypothetical protein
VIRFLLGLFIGLATGLWLFSSLLEAAADEG